MNTKIIMYRVSGFGMLKITEREIIKQSEKSVWFLRKSSDSEKLIEERELKSTQYYKWFNTKEEAIEYVKNRLESQIELKINELQCKKELLLKFQNKIDSGEI